MNYAFIENGVVSNLIVNPLPDSMEGVALNGRPVVIGDTYTDDVFLRDGEPVLTDVERIAQLEARVAELEAKQSQFKHASRKALFFV